MRSVQVKARKAGDLDGDLDAYFASAGKVGVAFCDESSCIAHWHMYEKR